MYAKRFFAVALAATFMLLAGPVGVARAEPGVSCEVLEIKATQGTTPSIPDSLKKLELPSKRSRLRCALMKPSCTTSSASSGLCRTPSAIA